MSKSVAKKSRRLQSLLVLFWIFTLSNIVKAQPPDYQLEVEGAGRFEGPIHLSNSDDLTSLFVGSEADSNEMSATSPRFNTLVGNLLLPQELNNSQYNTILGSLNFSQSIGDANTVLGSGAALLADLDSSIIIGVSPSTKLSGIHNIRIGNRKVNNFNESKEINGDRNVVVGHQAGANIKSGDGNVLIGFGAGPSTYDTQRSNRLYIHNEASDDPLIYGNFSSEAVRINGDLRIKYDLDIENDLVVNDDLTVLDDIQVSGQMGLGPDAPDLRLHVTGGTDVKPDGGGFAQIGSTAGTNLAFDNDEIMARSNGSVSRISINREGGDIEMLGTSPNAGHVGIGLLAPEAKLHVYSNSDAVPEDGGILVVGLTTGNNLAVDANEIMARDNGSVSRISINRDGGDVEMLGASPNVGHVGIGLVSPEAKLHVFGNSDADPEAGGILVVGSTSGNNIAVDANEIMARSNAAIAPLYLNFNGGAVQVGDKLGVGIGTNTPSADLDIQGSARFRNIPALSGSLDVRVDNNGFLSTSSSDRRLKKNIQTISNPLDKVDRLRGVSFQWKNEASTNTHHGLIAQEVLEVVPELVFENDGYFGVNYSEMAGLFIEGIKELHLKILELQLMNTQILNRLQALEEREKHRVQLSPE